MIVVDALTEGSSASFAAWPEVIREVPIISVESTIVGNLPIVGTNIKPALVATMSRVVVVVGGGDEGELVLVGILCPSNIVVVKNLPLFGDVVLSVCSSKHVV